MNILEEIRNENFKYIHGSEDSLDLDVYYVFEYMPFFQDCRKFCSEEKSENRNIICIENGVVSRCFIGTVDEVNNSLLDTYNLHEQKYPLIIERRLERDILIKEIRVVRNIISFLSRSQYRKQIKEALSSGWFNRLSIFNNIDFTKIDFDNLHKNSRKEDILKTFAFQFGQLLGLYDNTELYTKSGIANCFPELQPFLYRKENVDLNILNNYKNTVSDKLKNIDVLEDGQICHFIQYNRTINLKNEQDVKQNNVCL